MWRASQGVALARRMSGWARAGSRISPSLSRATARTMAEATSSSESQGMRKAVRGTRSMWARRKKGVRAAPGQMATQRTPVPVRSCCMLRVSAIRAALVAP